MKTALDGVKTVTQFFWPRQLVHEVDDITARNFLTLDIYLISCTILVDTLI